MPFLSDESKALAQYRQSFHSHGHFFFFYRHLLESFDSGTVVISMASRLVFTQTRQEFNDIVEQTISDFVTGCGGNLISLDAHRRFCRLVWAAAMYDGKGDRLPQIASTIFARQVLGRSGRLFMVCRMYEPHQGISRPPEREKRSWRQPQSKIVGCP
jgi:hypothetical protein